MIEIVLAALIVSQVLQDSQILIGFESRYPGLLANDLVHHMRLLEVCVLQEWLLCPADRPCSSRLDGGLRTTKV